MPRQLVQKLYLRDLPPGLNMSITNITPSYPPGHTWKVEFVRADGLKIGINENGNYPSPPARFPIPVAPVISQGLIGTVNFDGYNAVSSSGQGGKVFITIHIEGTAKVDGKPYQISDNGSIDVSATDWKGTARPDYTKTKFSSGKAAATDWPISVPQTGQPADAYFSVVMRAGGICSLIANAKSGI